MLVFYFYFRCLVFNGNERKISLVIFYKRHHQNLSTMSVNQTRKTRTGQGKEQSKVSKSNPKKTNDQPVVVIQLQNLLIADLRPMLNLLRF